MFIDEEDMGYAVENNQLLKEGTFYLTCQSYWKSSLKLDWKGKQFEEEKVSVDN